MIYIHLKVMKNTKTKRTLIVFCFYLLLSTSLLGVDYLVRLKQGYVQRASSWVSLSSEGIPIEVHSGLLLIFGCIAMIFLFKTMREIKNIYLRYSILIFQGLIGVFTTLIIWFYYVLETGIDSL